MRSFETLVVRDEGPVQIVRLNRPEKHNALNAQMSFELIECLDNLESDETVGVIVITGAGHRAFCAGGDMTEATQPNVDPEIVRAPSKAIGRVKQVRKPVIGAVNGYAYGGGALLAINCDILIATQNAEFRFIGARYGLVVGASRLPAMVGLARAKELILTTRAVGANEAWRIGLVNQVTSSEDLEQAALEMARAIVPNSPFAVEASKEVMEIAIKTGESDVREGELNRAARRSGDHQARFQAAADGLRSKV